MGFKYGLRDVHELEAALEQLHIASKSVASALQAMKEAELTSMYLALSDNNFTSLRNLSTAATLSNPMITAQLTAKKRGLPNPYEGNAERADAERDRKDKKGLVKKTRKKK